MRIFVTGGARLEEDIGEALYRLGFTMFTIDASDHIDLQAVHLSDEQALERFARLSDHREIRNRYLDKTWDFEKGDLSFSIEFSGAELARCALVYHQAINHMAQICHELTAAAGNSI